MIGTKPSAYRPLAILILTMAALAGCASIPSLAPFEQTTGKMVSGINNGYAASQGSLATVSPEQAAALAEALQTYRSSFSHVLNPQTWEACEHCEAINIQLCHE